MESSEALWLAERLAFIDGEIARLDMRAPGLNAQVGDPGQPNHEAAKWTALWDLRQRALLVEERTAILEARARVAG